jgi:hypothetical protein
MRRLAYRDMPCKQTIKCFLLFVPFFVLAVLSGSIYDDLHSNNIPDTVPSPKLTKAGQGITAAMVSGLVSGFC